MKICLITDGIWPLAVGGMQRHSYNLCKYLAKHGVNVDLVYTVKDPSAPVNLEDVFSKEELEFIRPIFVRYPTGLYFPGHYLWKSYQYSGRVFRAIGPSIKKYDLVYAQGLSGWQFINNKKKTGLPVAILNMHGLEMFQQPAGFRPRLEQLLFRPFTLRLLKHADFVQSLGGKLTSILLFHGVRKKQIVECPIGLETNWLSTNIRNSEGVKKFAFIGRYERRKGIQELNHVIEKLMSEQIEFQIRFIGPIPVNVRINDRRVIYHGMLDDDSRIKQVLDDVDFLIVPSYSEGMPTVILEGMARGCAIIASDVGAIPLLVSGENGFLVKPGDVQQLYECVKWCLEMNNETLAAMKRHSLEKASGYVWDKVIITMIDLFEKLTVNTSASCLIE
jgi:glycosyltransferase involved in cell wall biosynthesis